jgi:butyryl-CoA dehydrogenase
MAMETEAARALVQKACWMQEKEDPQSGVMAAMAKCLASDTAMKVSTTAVQVMGGNGYSKENQAEKYMRDAKVMQIYEGTNQIQRLVIANGVSY